MKNENYIDFPWIINVVSRRKWFIIISLALALIISLGILGFMPTRYQATTTLMIEPSENSKTSEINMLMAGERLALTYSKIINSRPILQSAISQLKSDTPVSVLMDSVSVQPVDNTQLIQISVTDLNPTKSISFANAIATSFIAYVKNLAVENYNQALTNTQNSITLKQSEVNRIISDINSQNKLKTDLEAEKARLQLLLTQNGETYRAVQQDIQSLEMAISNSKNKVHLVEAGYVLANAQYPAYTAAATVFFSRDIITGSSDTLVRTNELIAQVYGPMLYRDNLLEKVISKLSLKDSTATLSRRVSYEAVATSQFLRILVRDDNPSQAVQIASTLSELYIEQIQSNLSISDNKVLSGLLTQLENISIQGVKIQQDLNKNSAALIPIDLEIDRLQSDLSSKYLDLRNLQTDYDQLILEAGRATNTVVISEPAAHAKSLQANKYIYIGVVILLAVIAGFGLMFFSEHIDDKVRTQADISTLLGASPVGVIRHISRGKEKLISSSNVSTHFVEDFKILSALIRPSLKDLPLRTLLITSPHQGEGKSVIAANLAMAFAKTGIDVILVDADFRIPRQHVIFNVAIKGGFSDCLDGNHSDPQLKKINSQNLNLLTCGDQTDDTSELLTSPYLEKVLQTLSNSADLVIIDCPPILPLADVNYLTPFVDGALLVTRSGFSKRKAVLEAAAILKNADMKYLGIILNDIPESPEMSYRYTKEGNPGETNINS